MLHALPSWSLSSEGISTTQVLATFYFFVWTYSPSRVFQNSCSASQIAFPDDPLGRLNRCGCRPWSGHGGLFPCQPHGCLQLLAGTPTQTAIAVSTEFLEADSDP